MPAAPSSIRSAALLDAVKAGVGPTAGPMTVGPELHVVAEEGQQNALVLNTPADQSSVIHFKREGLFHWAILATAGEPARLEVIRYTPAGTPIYPPALSVDFATGAVDFSVMPTVGGVPIADAPEIEPQAG